MKTLLLTVAFFASAFAHGQTRGYKCLGETHSGVLVMVRGAFDQTTFEHVGLMEVIGTDTPASESSNREVLGTPAKPRKFPGDQTTVEYNVRNGFFQVHGSTSNGSQLDIYYQKGRTNTVNIELQKNATNGYYKHDFYNADCRYEDGKFFDWSWTYSNRNWPY